MKSFETSHDLDEIVPYLFFCELGSIFLMLFDHLEEVTVVSALHDNAEVSLSVLKEAIFISDDIWMLNRCQNSDFI